MKLIKFFNLCPPQSILVKEAFSKTDAEALRGDWEQVGKDLSNAINQFEKENKHILVKKIIKR